MTGCVGAGVHSDSPANGFMMHDNISMSMNIHILV